LHANPFSSGPVNFDKDEIAKRLLPENSNKSQISISNKEIQRMIRDHFVDMVARPLVHELVHAQIIVTEQRRGGKSGAAKETVNDLKIAESLALNSEKLSKSREGVFDVLLTVSPKQDKKDALKFFVQEKFVSQRIDQDVFGVPATNEIIARLYAETWIMRHVPESMAKTAIEMLKKALVKFFNDLDAELAFLRAAREPSPAGGQAGGGVNL
jgi:hypothetical protein